jgi:hypothetical protein
MAVYGWSNIAAEVSLEINRFISHQHNKNVKTGKHHDSSCPEQSGRP